MRRTEELNNKMRMRRRRKWRSRNNKEGREVRKGSRKLPPP